MKILKKLFLLCIPSMMFFSCESSEQHYVLSDVISKSEARKYYEDKLHGIVTVNDYKEGKYILDALNNRNSTNLLIGASNPIIKDNDKDKYYFYETIIKKCPVTNSSGVIYFEDKNFSFSMIETFGDDGNPTGKYLFMMVDEEDAEVNDFITEDASLSGDILTIKQEKEIFNPLVKKITESLKEQDIFNDKSAQPISKNIDEIDCEIYWVSGSGAYENSHYTMLQVDVPEFKYGDKNGSLYFYILQYDIGGDLYVTVEGAIIYGNKRKFIYKDFDGKLKD